MQRPRVQVLLSTYNGEKHIDEQIHSLLSQNRVEIHILIRDDGSTDGTVGKLHHYMNLYPDKIILFEKKNVGVVSSFFELIQHSQANFEYYAFCDQDDVWKGDKLSRAIEHLQHRNQGKPLMYCSATQMTEQDLTPIGVWPAVPTKPLAYYNALIENVCVGCTIVMNKEAMELVKKNPPNQMNIIMHDWWMYLIVSAFGEVVFDGEPSIFYRQHESNVLGGATDNWVNKWKKRFLRFYNGKNHYIISNQAKEFLSVFNHKMTIRQQNEVQKFIHSQQQNIFLRVFYVFKTPFYRQSAMDNIVFKLLYILAKV